MPAPSLAKSSSGASLTPVHTGILFLDLHSSSFDILLMVRFQWIKEVVQEGRLYHPTRDRPMNTGKRLPKRKSYERNQSAHLALSSPPSKATRNGFFAFPPFPPPQIPFLTWSDPLVRESAAERATAEEPHRMSFVITDTRTLQAKGSPFTVRDQGCSVVHFGTIRSLV